MRLQLFWSLFFGFLIFPLGILRAQTGLSNSEVQSFLREDYGGGSQNWAIAGDALQRIYVANNEGLLLYDGQRWQRFPVPNHTIVRSLCLGNDGRVYLGAQDELGYYAPDVHARLTYTSLKSSLPAQDRSFPDVWQIKANADGVFFRTTRALFRYHEQKMQVFKSATSWRSIHLHQGSLLAHDAAQGILLWKTNRWQTLIQASKLPTGLNISDIVSIGKDSSLVATEKHGLFYLVNDRLTPFPLDDSQLQPTQHFTALAVLPDKSLLVGTYFRGLYHLAPNGKVRYNISNRNGLHNNTVRALYANARNQVWIGLDNGIGYFEYQNAIRHLNPPSFLNGVGYAVKQFGNDCYFALSTGIHFQPNNAENPVPSPLLNGLSWNLSLVENRLFASRDDGFWEITNRQTIPIDRSTGYWIARKPFNLLKNGSNLVAGNYEGLQLFQMNGAVVSNLGRFPGFDESCRYLEIDGKTIWVSHPYRGVYRINSENGKVHLLNAASGLPENLNNHVFYIRGRIVVGSNQGVFELDKQKQRFQPSDEYRKLLGNLPIRYLTEDAQGNVWFVQDKLPGVIDFQSGKPKVVYFPELANKVVSGFENIYPLNLSNIYFGSDEGFYILNYERYRRNLQPFSSYLSGINSLTENDSLLFGGFIANQSKSKEDVFSIPFSLNSLRFTFAATDVSPQARLEFSYQLAGFSTEWSEWSQQTAKDFTNLKEGNYTLSLKARRGPNRESAIYQYHFRILPPFYRTNWAYGIYGVAIFGFLYALLKVQARKHRKKQAARRLADRLKFEEEQKQMAYQHQLDLEKTEKEFMRLQTEKLEAEIKHKNAELATATMNLVQKKEFILKLKAELAQLQKGQQDSADTPELRKLLKTLGEEEKLNKEWDHFAQHFNSVHGNFLQILKSKFPLLKPHEMQLCAYLRMNLSSKEIAPLMSISVRGVEISRYRLRKKLNLSTEENLVQYLMDLKS